MKPVRIKNDCLKARYEQEVWLLERRKVKNHLRSEEAQQIRRTLRLELRIFVMKLEKRSGLWLTSRLTD